MGLHASNNNDSLDLVRSLRNPEQGTLTLTGTPQKDITTQRFRSAPFTLLALSNNWSLGCLFVRRVCKNEIK